LKPSYVVPAFDGTTATDREKGKIELADQEFEQHSEQACILSISLSIHEALEK
jgi:hypothetical protein